MNKSISMVGIIIMLGLSINVNTALSQVSKYGKISKADLASTGYPEDPDAQAVVLFDQAIINLDGNFKLYYERHTRIKIFDKNAFEEWGSVEIPYNTALKQNVRHIKAGTFNLVNGKIKQDKVNKKQIFDEKLEGKNKVKKFTFPNLQPGSIIEYEYRWSGDFGGNIPGWIFQSTEPTLWSQYEVKLPDFLAYTTLAQGIVGFDVHENETFLDPINRMEGKIFKWVLQNVPAFRNEPYMTARTDHIKKLDLHLHSFFIGGRKTVLLDSWNTVVKTLLEHRQFGGAMKARKLTKRATEEVLAGLGELPSAKEKMIAIYEYVRDHTKWNGRRGIYSHESLADYALKEEESDAAEINFALMAMLREAGLKVDPVLLSTRDNGKPYEGVPLLDQFNYVVAGVLMGGQTHLLDATSNLRPWSMLPTRALNLRGLKIMKKGPVWIDIKPKEIYRRVTMINAELNDQGDVSGTLNTSEMGYAGLIGRALLSDKNHEEYIHEFIAEDWEESALDSLSISNIDSLHLALKSEVNFNIEAMGAVANDFIYLDHVLIDRTEENPLKLEERTFPVNFTYPTTKEYVLNLTIPDGYVVTELPKGIRLSLPNKGGLIQRRIQAEGQRITVHTKLIFRHDIYTPNEYRDLRTFYDEMITIEGEQIVLQKSKEEASDG